MNTQTHKWTNGIILEKKYNSSEYKDKYPIVFSKVENVIREGRKYNLIDRFFHYSIEETEMLKNIDFQNLSEDAKQDISKCIEVKFKILKFDLFSTIKYCHGLHSFNDYLNNTKSIILDNPSLLGISPFIFSQTEWEDMILKEIKSSGYTRENHYNVTLIIRNCLKETLLRLDKENFENLRMWEDETMSTTQLFRLVDNKIFETVLKSKSSESVIKELIKKNTVTNSSRIILKGNFTTGKLIEKFNEGFGTKGIKLNNEELNDIKNFISLNFKNSKGKNIEFQNISNRSFFSHHKKLITNILIINIKNIGCEKKDIARLYKKTFPELVELKTIENY